MRLMAIAGLLALTACGTYETAGSGEMTDGTPVSGVLRANLGTNTMTVGIISSEGWNCGAQTEGLNDNAQVKILPLSCSDRRTGRLVLTANQIQGQVVGAFTLSNRASGRVVFGKL